MGANLCFSEVSEILVRNLSEIGKKCPKTKAPKQNVRKVLQLIYTRRNKLSEPEYSPHSIHMKQGFNVFHDH